MVKNARIVADSIMTISGVVLAPLIYERLGELMIGVRGRLKKKMRPSDQLVWSVSGGQKFLVVRVTWIRDGKEYSSAVLEGSGNAGRGRGEGEKMAMLLVLRTPLE